MSGAVPQLRFPGFSGEWKALRLSALISALDAGVSVNSSEGAVSSDGFGVLKTSCVTTGKFDLSESKLVDDPDEILRLKEPVQAGTVIISRMNTPQLVGANAYVSCDAPNIFLPDRLWAAKVRAEVSARWFGYLMGHPATRAAMSDRASGTSGSMKNLAKDAVLSLDIFAPEATEQQKIADFLGAVDAKLETLRRKKSGLEVFKSGLMQRLFSQALRFTRDDGTDFPDWEEMRVGNIAEINPKTGPLPSEFQYVDLGSVTAGVLGDTKTLSASEAPSRAQRNLKPSDILFQMVRPYQRNNLFFSEEGHFVASTGYAQLRAKQDPGFLYQAIHTDRFVNDVLERCTGTGYPAINSNDLASITVPVPHPEEQRKIADALSALDAKIAALAGQITHMETFKKGLLQQMFV